MPIMSEQLQEQHESLPLHDGAPWAATVSADLQGRRVTITVRANSLSMLNISLHRLARQLKAWDA